MLLPSFVSSKFCFDWTNLLDIIQVLHSHLDAPISASTAENHFYPLAAAEDACSTNASYMSVQNCQQPDAFIPAIARRKIIICSYTTDYVFTPRSIESVIDTIQTIGAAGFIFTMGRSLDSQPIAEANLPLSVPGIILSSREASQVLLTLLLFMFECAFDG